MRLICHTVGSQPFQSPVLSFYAMLSRTRAHAGGKAKAWAEASRVGSGDTGQDEALRKRLAIGGWHEPGNYSSSLSALVWMAQLLIFETVCHHDGKNDGRDNEDFLEQLGKLCRTFMHQAGKTVFGFILQCGLPGDGGQVGRGEKPGTLVVGWRGNHLPWDDNPHPPAYSAADPGRVRRARNILFDSLLFGLGGVEAFEAHRIHDDLDAEDHGGSWMTDPRNAKLLGGADKALLQYIGQDPTLRGIFFILDNDNRLLSSSSEAKQTKQTKQTKQGQKEKQGLRLSRQAMAIYKASVQEFLQALITLMHISPMLPSTGIRASYNNIH